MSKPGPRSYRPALHFTAPSMWLNDPNGLVYEEGRYHLYYQHHPYSTVWGPMHWGHAVSTDLLHWEHQPIALSPDALGTIFSGSAVLDLENSSGFGSLGRPPIVAVYTSHGAKEQQSIAFSLDRGRSFQKYEGNPVIPNPGITNFRDPKVFCNPVRGGWGMVVSAHDRVHFYASHDLKSWEKTGEFGLSENLLPDSVWECPDLFPLFDGERERWVLLASMILPPEQGGHRTQYFLGQFDGSRFLCDSPFNGPEFIDMGFDNYAGCTYFGAPVRTFIGWAASPVYAGETPTGPFCGQMTLPRAVRLVKTPLGGTRLSFQPLGLSLDSGKGREITGSLPLTAGPFALRVRARPGCEIVLSNRAGECLRFGLDRENRIWCDRSASSCAFSEAFCRPPFQRMSAPRFYEGECELDAVFDVCSLELYADGGARCGTFLAYPTVPYDRVSASGAAAQLIELDR
ncbi:MAG: glycoside hydrolase family 32 protein [Provencibacterium sp.]|jgi:fructan beta-fructosidase|nr:glycoside hydrolase family 32 protein [Provencibacterium sp.]